MKVRVNLSIDIDEQQYADIYGISTSEVRADLKTTAAQAVYDQLLRVTGTAVSVKEV